MSDDERGTITAAIERLEKACQEGDREAIDRASEELGKHTSGLAEKLYAKQQAGTSAERPDESAPADDKVVDAEFEEVDKEKK